MTLNNDLDPLLQPPADRLLRRQLHWLLLTRVIVLTLLLGVSALLGSDGKMFILPPLPYLLGFIASVYGITILSALVLRKIRQINLFAYLQVMADVVLVSLLVFFTGSSQSIFTVLYFFPVITAGAILFRTGSLLMACLCTLSYAIVLIIEYLGYFPAYFRHYRFTPITEYQAVLQHFAIPGLTFFLTAILSSLLSNRLRRTEAALSQTTRDYDRLAELNKQIMDDISTGIITVAEDGRINSFNRAAEEITGFQANEMIGAALETVLPSLGAVEKTSLRLTADLTRKDGEKIPVGYSWTRLNLPEGCGNCRVYTMQDLSHIRKMEAQVQQAEKMATIGEMAAGVAHEFRNPLAAISGAAQLLRKDVAASPSSATKTLMNIIVRECDRLDGTIEEFLQFSKPSSPDRRWFNLHSLSEECLQLLHHKSDWDETCPVHNAIPVNLEAYGEPDQIKQVIINLITNACTAMKGTDGKIELAAVEKETADGHETTVLTVFNSGPAIAVDLLETIFEPFFTTRDNGTGLGLAIVRQIVERHGGNIQAENLATGVVFTVTLPLP